MHKEKNRNLYSFVILILLGTTTAFELNSLRDSIETGNFQSEIDENIAELKELIEIIDDNDNAIRNLSLMLSKEDYNLDTIIKYSARMSLLLEFIPRKKTYDTIKSADILPDDLLNAAELLYRDYEEIQKADKLHKKYIVDHIITYLRDNIDMINGKALNNNFYKTEYFRNILTDYLHILSQQREGYKKGLEISIKLKEMILEKN